MLKAVIFDLDNTLYDFTETENITLSYLYSYGTNLLDLDEGEFEKAYLWGRAKHKENLPNVAATHNRTLYFQYMLEHLGLNPFDYLESLVNYYSENFLHNVKLYDGALTLIDDLKRTGLKIGVLTDMTSLEQYRKIDILHFGHYIDAFVSSEEIGEEKPSPKMFERILAKLGTKASDTIMLGDSLVRDIEGAEKAGIKAIWKAPSEEEGEKSARDYYLNYTDGKLRFYLGLA